MVFVLNLEGPVHSLLQESHVDVLGVSREEGGKFCPEGRNDKVGIPTSKIR